ncbi:hypothetical protein PSECIP111951_01629 [Pseudoalteromonas holothuriae]|uniref:Solute-binding protein family 3/N-terminal domain-containing protein n=1 Tax=Pseudoalteromonas holothuriae TaxID=2963714 RepID=A0A9W4QSU1_9GAMM|nr:MULTISPECIES: transporter substrate-binding domain-containing protein [unclassified Pseudoalteromonas]CAH9051725.1 hypothetical protein PSECIP111854_00818 [Pseudoalteromonas sp. CIP111854]CAH9057250.1 hypothetical protein PSECIP111951_01629 [Pseudoalteromonas sp. CIP111951]
MKLLSNRPVLVIIFSCLIFVSEVSFAKQAVSIYAYHLKPPYIIDSEEEVGLYFDLTTLLNKYQQGFLFKLEYMPRRRLNRDIEQNSLDGLIMGVNPVWFRDRQQKKFAWSVPFMNDRDEFVSHVKTPFEFKGPVSLYNKAVGGVRGYHYFQVAPVIRIEKATLVETGSELQLLEMIVKQRLDVAVISRATVNFFVAQHEYWQKDVYFSELPHESYSRAIVATKQMRDVIKSINEVMKVPAFVQELQQLLAQYHITEKDLEIKR